MPALLRVLVAVTAFLAVVAAGLAGFGLMSLSAARSDIVTLRPHVEAVPLAAAALSDVDSAIDAAFPLIIAAVVCAVVAFVVALTHTVLGFNAAPACGTESSNTPTSDGVGASSVHVSKSGEGSPASDAVNQNSAKRSRKSLSCVVPIPNSKPSSPLGSADPPSENDNGSVSSHNAEDVRSPIVNPLAGPASGSASEDSDGGPTARRPPLSIDLHLPPGPHNAASSTGDGQRRRRQGSTRFRRRLVASVGQDFTDPDGRSPAVPPLIDPGDSKLSAASLSITSTKGTHSGSTASHPRGLPPRVPVSGRGPCSAATTEESASFVSGKSLPDVPSATAGAGADSAMITAMVALLQAVGPAAPNPASSGTLVPVRVVGSVPLASVSTAQAAAPCCDMPAPALALVDAPVPEHPPHAHPAPASQFSASTAQQSLANQPSLSFGPGDSTTTSGSLELKGEKLKHTHTLITPQGGVRSLVSGPAERSATPTRNTQPQSTTDLIPRFGDATSSPAGVDTPLVTLASSGTSESERSQSQRRSVTVVADAPAAVPSPQSPQVICDSAGSPLMEEHESDTSSGDHAPDLPCPVVGDEDTKSSEAGQGRVCVGDAAVRSRRVASLTPIAIASAHGAAAPDGSSEASSPIKSVTPLMLPSTPVPTTARHGKPNEHPSTSAPHDPPADVGTPLRRISTDMPQFKRYLSRLQLARTTSLLGQVESGHHKGPSDITGLGEVTQTVSLPGTPVHKAVENAPNTPGFDHLQRASTKVGKSAMASTNSFKASTVTMAPQSSTRRSSGALLASTSTDTERQGRNWFSPKGEAPQTPVFSFDGPRVGCAAGEVAFLNLSPPALSSGVATKLDLHRLFERQQQHLVLLQHQQLLDFKGRTNSDLTPGEASGSPQPLPAILPEEPRSVAGQCEPKKETPLSPTSRGKDRKSFMATVSPGSVWDKPRPAPTATSDGALAPEARQGPVTFESALRVTPDRSPLQPVSIASEISAAPPPAAMGDSFGPLEEGFLLRAAAAGLQALPLGGTAKSPRHSPSPLSANVLSQGIDTSAFDDGQRQVLGSDGKLVDHLLLKQSTGHEHSSLGVVSSRVLVAHLRLHPPGTQGLSAVRHDVLQGFQRRGLHLFSVLSDICRDASEDLLCHLQARDADSFTVWIAPKPKDEAKPLSSTKARAADTDGRQRSPSPQPLHLLSAHRSPSRDGDPLTTPRDSVGPQSSSAPALAVASAGPGQSSNPVSEPVRDVSLNVSGSPTLLRDLPPGISNFDAAHLPEAMGTSGSPSTSRSHSSSAHSSVSMETSNALVSMQMTATAAAAAASARPPHPRGRSLQAFSPTASHFSNDLASRRSSVCSNVSSRSGSMAVPGGVGILPRGSALGGGRRGSPGVGSPRGRIGSTSSAGLHSASAAPPLSVFSASGANASAQAAANLPRLPTSLAVDIVTRLKGLMSGPLVAADRSVSLHAGSSHTSPRQRSVFGDSAPSGGGAGSSLQASAWKTDVTVSPFVSQDLTALEEDEPFSSVTLHSGVGQILLGRPPTLASVALSDVEKLSQLAPAAQCSLIGTDAFVFEHRLLLPDSIAQGQSCFARQIDFLENNAALYELVAARAADQATVELLRQSLQEYRLFVEALGQGDKDVAKVHGAKCVVTLPQQSSPAKTEPDVDAPSAAAAAALSITASDTASVVKNEAVTATAQWTSPKAQVDRLLRIAATVANGQWYRKCIHTKWSLLPLGLKKGGAQQGPMHALHQSVSQSPARSMMGSVAYPAAFGGSVLGAFQRESVVHAAFPRTSSALSFTDMGPASVGVSLRGLPPHAGGRENPRGQSPSRRLPASRPHASASVRPSLPDDSPGGSKAARTGSTATTSSGAVSMSILARSTASGDRTNSLSSHAPAQSHRHSGLGAAAQSSVSSFVSTSAVSPPAPAPIATPEHDTGEALGPPPQHNGPRRNGPRIDGNQNSGALPPQAPKASPRRQRVHRARKGSSSVNASLLALCDEGEPQSDPRTDLTVSDGTTSGRGSPFSGKEKDSAPRTPEDDGVLSVRTSRNDTSSRTPQDDDSDTSSKSEGGLGVARVNKSDNAGASRRGVTTFVAESLDRPDASPRPGKWSGNSGHPAGPTSPFLPPPLEPVPAICTAPQYDPQFGPTVEALSPDFVSFRSATNGPPPAAVSAGSATAASVSGSQRGLLPHSHAGSRAASTLGAPSVIAGSSGGLLGQHLSLRASVSEGRQLLRRNTASHGEMLYEKLLSNAVYRERMSLGTAASIMQCGSSNGGPGEDGQEWADFPQGALTGDSAFGGVPAQTLEHEVPVDLADDWGGRWHRSNVVIGSGSFAHVYLAMRADTGGMVALKSVPLELFQNNRDHAQAFGQEVSLLTKLRHQNVVEYKSFAVTAHHAIVVMEYVSGGTLASIVESFGALSEAICLNYMHDVLEGLAFLHRSDVMHRDVKPHNVLVTLDGVCKISDFGTAKSLDDEGNGTVQGSPLFMAPEQARGHPSSKSDIWGAGLVLLHMITGQLPYDDSMWGLPFMAFVFKLGSESGMAPEIPTNASPKIQGLLMRCLARDPDDRPSAEELLQDDAFAVAKRRHVRAPSPLPRLIPPQG